MHFLPQVKKNLEQSVPRRSTRSPLPLRVVTSLGSIVKRDRFNHAGWRPRALFTLRESRRGQLKAWGWEAQAVEIKDKAWEAKKQIVDVLETLWDSFWYPNLSRIHPKTNLNHEKSSLGSLFWIQALSGGALKVSWGELGAKYVPNGVLGSQMLISANQC